MLVPKTTKYKNPNTAVALHDLPYTAQTRKKKRRLFVFRARIERAEITFIIAWQLLMGATAGF